jgi:hypothetical protein
MLTSSALMWARRRRPPSVILMIASFDMPLVVLD